MNQILVYYVWFKSLDSLLQTTTLRFPQRFMWENASQMRSETSAKANQSVSSRRQITFSEPVRVGQK